MKKNLRVGRRGGNIVCTHADRTVLGSGGGRSNFQRRGAQIGCLRLGGLGESVFLTDAGRSLGAKGLGGRGRNIFLIGTGRSQGRCNGHDEHGSGEVAGSMLEVRVRLGPREKT